ncbi:hypothetical protein [Mesorhizobium sp.]|uniref:hypothetical protein n=1 Tax=Mesorhizobium sp. TaxID=1871066 RepID=UPI000FE60E1F|nr:hypothetical protein [Mesorhizobium sp.]RWH01207.1 MAG: hypothetical protein EOQ71_23760 [Mesorhizobium sp.]
MTLGAETLWPLQMRERSEALTPMSAAQTRQPRPSSASGAIDGVDFDVSLPRHARRRLAAMDAPGFEEKRKEGEIHR